MEMSNQDQTVVKKGLVEKNIIFGESYKEPIIENEDQENN